MLCTLDAVRRNKSPTENCCCVLFMTCWTNFKWCSAFALMRPDRLQLLRRVWCRLRYREEPKQPRRPIAGLPLLEFSPALESWSDIYTGPTSCHIVPSLLCFIRHLYRSVTQLGCALNALSSTSWADTPLTADWLHVCFGTRPRLNFIKRFRKMTYPTFN